MAERRSIDLAGRKKATNKGTGSGKGQRTQKESSERHDRDELDRKARQGRRRVLDSYADDDEDDEDEDDEIIQKSKKSSLGGNGNKIIFGVAAAVLVLVVFVVFLLLNGGQKTEKVEGTGAAGQQQMQDSGTKQESNILNENDFAPDEPDRENGTTALLDGVGTQDFTQNTTMESDSEMEDASEYTKDIYGLTTRVDYTVDKILNVTDFVEYEKHRGTWGGGLELYWLEATYKGAKYVVQVPFQYYKELDDIGIVPVKMEVLKITGEGDGDDRTVISYMGLDQETLEDVMKTQSKAWDS